MSASRRATPYSQLPSDVPLRTDRGLVDQDQERGLEHVVGIGPGAEQAAADAEDHRPVPAQQLLEGGLVAARGKAIEEVAVGRLAGGGRAQQAVEVAQDGAEVSLSRGHGSASPGALN